MKLTIKLTLAGLLVLVILATGCATTGAQAPPSAIEKTLFNVTTNVTTLTNYVTQTNLVITTQTNVQNQIVTVTNLVPQLIPTPFNVTNYTFLPKPAITDTATALGPLAGPWGTVASIALAGVLGIWGKLRSNQADTASAVAATGVQAVATAKSVLAALPNGAALSKAYDDFLTAHASDANLAAEIAAFVDEEVDPHAANGAALSILQAATTPIPTVTNAVKV